MWAGALIQCVASHSTGASARAGYPFPARARSTARLALAGTVRLTLVLRTVFREIV